MEHRVGYRKLQRTTSHRIAMLRNMVTSLLEHERIETTLRRAKEARRMAERIIRSATSARLRSSIRSRLTR